MIEYIDYAMPNSLNILMHSLCLNIQLISCSRSRSRDGFDKCFSIVSVLSRSRKILVLSVSVSSRFGLVSVSKLKVSFTSEIFLKVKILIPKNIANFKLVTGINFKIWQFDIWKTVFFCNKKLKYGNESQLDHAVTVSVWLRNALCRIPKMKWKENHIA